MTVGNAIQPPVVNGEVYTLMGAGTDKGQSPVDQPVIIIEGGGQGTSSVNDKPTVLRAGDGGDVDTTPTVEVVDSRNKTVVGSSFKELNSLFTEQVAELKGFETAASAAEANVAEAASVIVVPAEANVAETTSVIAVPAEEVNSWGALQVPANLLGAMYGLSYDVVENASLTDRLMSFSHVEDRSDLQGSALLVSVLAGGYFGIKLVQSVISWCNNRNVVQVQDDRGESGSLVARTEAAPATVEVAEGKEDGKAKVDASAPAAGAVTKKVKTAVRGKSDKKAAASKKGKTAGRRKSGKKPAASEKGKTAAEEKGSRDGEAKKGASVVSATAPVMTATTATAAAITAPMTPAPAPAETTAEIMTAAPAPAATMTPASAANNAEKAAVATVATAKAPAVVEELTESQKREAVAAAELEAKGKAKAAEAEFVKVKEEMGEARRAISKIIASDSAFVRVVVRFFYELFNVFPFCGLIRGCFDKRRNVSDKDVNARIAENKQAAEIRGARAESVA